MLLRIEEVERYLGNRKVRKPLQRHADDELRQTEAQAVQTRIRRTLSKDHNSQRSLPAAVCGRGGRSLVRPRNGLVEVWAQAFATDAFMGWLAVVSQPGRAPDGEQGEHSTPTEVGGAHLDRIADPPHGDWAELVFVTAGSELPCPVSAPAFDAARGH